MQGLTEEGVALPAAAQPLAADIVCSKALQVAALARSVRMWICKQ